MEVRGPGRTCWLGRRHCDATTFATTTAESSPPCVIAAVAVEDGVNARHGDLFLTVGKCDVVENAADAGQAGEVGGAQGLRLHVVVRQCVVAAGREEPTLAEVSEPAFCAAWAGGLVLLVREPPRQVFASAGDALVRLS